MRCRSVGCGTANQTRFSNAIGHAEHRSRSHDAVVRVYDDTRKVIETHEHPGEFKSSEKVQAAILRKEEENGRP
jgi:hypothetical protein